MPDIAENPQMAVINLAEIAADPNRDTISGRSAGEAARKRLGLEEIHDRAMVRIDIPAHVRVVTPSFFIGLLGDTVSSSRTYEEAKARFVLSESSAVTRMNLDHAIAGLFRSGTAMSQSSGSRSLFGSWRRD